MPQIKTQISSGSSPSNAAVPQSRAINTTAPLQGGGTLNNDLTLSIDTTNLGDAFVGQTNYFTAPNFFAGPSYTGATASGAARFVTSGELQTGAGTGDAIRNADNFWTGAKNVFGSTTAVTISGSALTVGGLQISGSQNVAYGPIYNNAFAIAASRYVTSGELAGIGSASGDAIRGQDNFWTGSQNVFSPTTNVTVSGTLQVGTSTTYSRHTSAGGIQISGAGGAALDVWSTKSYPLQVGNAGLTTLMRVDTLLNGVVIPNNVLTQAGFTIASITATTSTANTVPAIQSTMQAVHDNGRGWAFQDFPAAGSYRPIIAGELIIAPSFTVMNAATGMNGWKATIMASGTVGGALRALGTVLTSGDVFHFGGAVYNGRSVSGVDRYITSGELSTGAGTGDAIRGADNFFYGSKNVFGPATTVVISGGLTILGTLGNAAGRSLVVTGSGYYQGRSQFEQLLDSDRVSFNIPTRFLTPHSVGVFGDFAASGELRSYRNATFGDPDAANGLALGQLFHGNQPTSDGVAWVLVGSGSLYGSFEMGSYDGAGNFTINSIPADFIGTGRVLFDETKNIVARGNIQVSGTLRTYSSAIIPDITDTTGMSRFNIGTANTLIAGTAYANATATAANRYVTSGELRGVSIRTLDRQTTPAGVDGTAVYTQAYSSAVGAGLLGSTKSFKLSAIGSVGNADILPHGFGLRVLYGNTVVFSGGLDAATNVLTAGTNRPWRIDTDVQALNATNRQGASSQAVFGAAGATSISGEAQGSAVTFEANHLMMAVDSTTSQNVELWVQNGATSVTSQVTWVRLELQQ